MFFEHGYHIEFVYVGCGIYDAGASSGAFGRSFLGRLGGYDKCNFHCVVLCKANEAVCLLYIKRKKCVFIILCCTIRLCVSALEAIAERCAVEDRATQSNLVGIF